MLPQYYDLFWLENEIVPYLILNEQQGFKLVIKNLIWAWLIFVSLLNTCKPFGYCAEKDYKNNMTSYSL